MAVVMHRSFARSMGFNWPPEIASIVNGVPVTYAEIRANKIARQRKHLAGILKCEGPQRRAAHVWTFFIPGWIYGGWHLYIRTINERWWIRECDAFALSIMALFPCGLLPTPENFGAWKLRFARTYARGLDRQQGMVAGWIDLGSGRPKRFHCIEKHNPPKERQIMEIRAQIAYHFKLDPAQLSACAVRIPEMITRTISVGDELVTEKVASEIISPADRAALLREIDKQVREATRTARPAGSEGIDWQVAAKQRADEMSAF